MPNISHIWYHEYMGLVGDTKQLNPWPNSSASPVVKYSRLSACRGDMEVFEGDLNTHGCLKSLRNKLQQNQPGQLYHQHLAELSVNIYSYCLMVKVYLDVMCVEGGFSQIQSHNY